MERREFEATREGELLKRLDEGCALDHYEIHAVLQQPNPRQIDIPLGKIPPSYFRRGPVLHTMGSGPDAIGKIEPAPLGDAKKFFREMFSYGAHPDRRPTYLCPIIKRTDVLRLKTELELSERSWLEGAAETSGLAVAGVPAEAKMGSQSIKVQAALRRVLAEDGKSLDDLKSIGPKEFESILSRKIAKGVTVPNSSTFSRFQAKLRRSKMGLMIS
jgi:hypothetical protein